jgi:hypothetical protein
MKAKKINSGRGAKKKSWDDSRIRANAYGGKVTICINAECILRKKAKCFGFEGCPGFKGK